MAEGASDTVDTSTAGFTESPQISLTTICGLSSTSVISSLASPDYPTVSTSG
jgi:hypothetical protein